VHKNQKYLLTFRRVNPSAEVFLRVEGQLDHPLQELVGPVTGKVLVDQLLGEKATEVAHAGATVFREA